MRTLLMGNKDPKNKKQTQEDTSQDLSYAMLSLLSQETRETAPCPKAEDLAAFSEGRLRGETRKKIMAHLADCASCRRQWLLVESTMDEMDASQATWIGRIISNIKSIKPRHAFAGGGLGFALATCLLLIFLVPRQSELSKMIANSYAGLSPANIARYNSFVSRGAAEDLERPASDALLAYKAGVAAGKAHLLNQSNAVKKKQVKEDLDSLLYSMGQWAVLLQCVCISPGPASDELWSEQNAIAVKLQNQLKAAVPSKVGQQLIQTVAKIQMAIKQILETGDQADGCEDIALAMQALESHLRLNLYPRN